VNGLADLINPRVLRQAPALPALMVGTLVSTSPVRVRIPVIDGGAFSHEAFGVPPAGVSTGGEVRVMSDENDGLVVVAWQ
jgi:hypothetical protein